MTVIYTSHYMEEVEALCDRVAIIDPARSSRLGTIARADRAARRQGHRARARRATSSAAARAAAAHGTVTRDGHDAARRADAPASAPAIAAIEASGATIARIESRQANLETAFLALTGRALRDETRVIGAAIRKDVQLLLRDRGRLLIACSRCRSCSSSCSARCSSSAPDDGQPRPIAIWHAPGDARGAAIAKALGDHRLRRRIRTPSRRRRPPRGRDRRRASPASSFPPTGPVELSIDLGAPGPGARPARRAR